MTNEQLQPQVMAVADMATRRASDYKSIYANNTKFNTNAFDFSMIFSEIAENVEGQLYIEQKIKIMMSPLHAKIFTMVLLQNIHNFEARFGEIRVPDKLSDTENSVPTPQPPGSPTSLEITAE